MFDEDDGEGDKKKEKEINKIIHNAERTFDIEARIANHNEGTFGICSNCKNFMFAEAEFVVVFAKCGAFDNHLTQKNAIKNCSLFDKKGSMTLWDMRSMATLIDDGSTKREIGFCKKEEDEDKV